MNNKQWTILFITKKWISVKLVKLLSQLVKLALCSNHQNLPGRHLMYVLSWGANAVKLPSVASWLNTSKSESYPDWMIQQPLRAFTGLRAVSLYPYRQAAVLTCVAHACPAALALLERVPETGCGREGSVPSPTRKQQFCGETGARLFLDDLLLWVLMVGLVSSDNWHIRLMRLNSWFLTHLWTQIVLAFVLITDHTMLT